MSDIDNYKLGFFDFNINFGGAPRGTLSLAKALELEGLNVIIYDAYGANSDYASAINKLELDVVILDETAKRTFLGNTTFSKLFYFCFQAPKLFRLTFRLRRRLTVDARDFIWVNNVKSLLLVALASFGKKIKICYYHRGWALPSETPFYAKLIVKVVKPKLCAHSKATVRNLAEIFPYADVRYLPNSVTVSTDDAFKLRREEGVFYVILPAARPVKEKGLWEAIKSLALLKKSTDKKVNLIITGTIPTGVDDSFYASLLNEVKKDQLFNEVMFIGWVKNVASLIAQCDLTILPSYTEGFPRVIIESMIVGTPVVATPVGGIPEAIEPDVTGILVSVGNIEELSDAMKRVIDLEPDARTLLIQRAQQKAEKMFSQSEQINQFIKIIKG